MDRMSFKTCEDFVYEIENTFEDIYDEYDFNDISIIAKYDEAKEIIKELILIGYDIVSIDISDEEFVEYWDEYIISLTPEGIYCEKFKRDSGYFTDESTVTYIMDNCSSNVIPNCIGKTVYEVFVDAFDDDHDNYDDEVYEESEESCVECNYVVNGRHVNKETFDKHITKFNENLENNNSEYTMTVKFDLSKNGAEKEIRDMRDYVNRKMSDMFDLLYRPFLYEYYLYPSRFRW